MNTAPIYKAVHTETGESFEGTAKELAEIIGVTNITISKVALEGRKAKGFKIDKISESKGSRHDNKFCKDIIAEWEAVTRPFREASLKQRKRCTL
jgi:hypothetical protein